ncbi:MAG: iron-sulfur cluster assembly scaffold protein [Dehalococcoidales bacterium]|nr:iron-sulfur cluster assembly scaffold protein [Dehalococcoidales bacterium]
MGKGLFSLSKKVMDRLSNPRNVGVIENPDGVGYVGDPSLGIDLELYIKVKDNIITDAKFKAFGCAATIATVSMVSEMLVGKSIEQALGISDKEIAETLDGLPPSKMHCAELGRELIKSAIDDLFKKKGY